MFPYSPHHKSPHKTKFLPLKGQKTTKANKTHQDNYQGIQASWCEESGGHETFKLRRSQLEKGCPGRESSKYEGPEVS